MQVRLFRRSDLSPTRTKGVVGQKCRTSGYHCGRQPMKVYQMGVTYLVHDIFERIGTVNGEADE